MDNYHITKKDTKWQLTKEGNTRPSKTAETKSAIVQETRDFMKSHSGSVKIHKQDGKIQEERTYPRKNDPKSTPG